MEKEKCCNCLKFQCMKEKKKTQMKWKLPKCTHIETVTETEVSEGVHRKGKKKSEK